MTIIDLKRTKCAVCGRRVEIGELTSCTSFGHPDLDFRPPERARSTLGFRMQQCPKCGYCSEQLGETRPGVAAIVLDEAYQNLWKERRRTDPISLGFHLAAIIAVELGDTKSAFHYSLNETWEHDDRRKAAEAGTARLRALDLLNQTHQKGETAFDRDGCDEAVAVDLLRRVGDFAGAEERCSRALAEGCDEEIRKLLEYQLELCNLRDMEPHTTEMAFK